MSKLKEKFKNISTKNKIRFVAAMLITCATIAYVPTLAWFSNQRQIVKLQRVEMPNVLYLTAAHRQDSQYLEVTGIDTDEGQVDSYGNAIMDPNNPAVQQKIDHKDYAICVTGDSISQFMIQIAYTTNNPFKYELYAADEKTLSEMTFPAPGVEPDYVAVDVKGNSIVGAIIDNELNAPEYHSNITAPADENVAPTTLYYKINTNASGTEANGKYTNHYLNSSDEGKTANDTKLDESYGSYSNIDVHAKPVYAQITGLDAFPSNSGSNNANNKKPFSRHFILRVSWDNTLDNKSKETDIVYLTVKATG